MALPRGWLFSFVGLVYVFFPTVICTFLSLSPVKEDANAIKELQKSVRDAANENRRIMSKSKSEGISAEVQLSAAEKRKKEGEKILNGALKIAEKVATETAAETLKAVKLRAKEELEKASENEEKMQIEMEKQMAEKVASAAAPYHENELRAERLVVEYKSRASEYAAAGNNLVSQAQDLANRAPQYQAFGQAILANQIMMQAHQLMRQGKTMQENAKSLHNAAVTMNANISAYHYAAYGAAVSAEAEFAEDVNLDGLEKLYPY